MSSSIKVPDIVFLTIFPNRGEQHMAEEAGDQKDPLCPCGSQKGEQQPVES